MTTSQDGFTLLELMAVLVLVALIAAVCLPAFERGTRGVELRLCRDQLKRDLRAARADAVGNKLTTVVRFHGSTYTVVLAEGDPLQRELPAGFYLAADGLGHSPEADALVFWPDGRTNGGILALVTPRHTVELHVMEDGSLVWH